MVSNASTPHAISENARAIRTSTTSSGSNVSTGPTVVIKKYSCMYTPDVHKTKKVWHDGQVKLHHVNSKACLYSECSERLAESFVKIAARRSRSTDRTAPRASCQLPENFELKEDEEIEFDEVENTHQLRGGQFLAQIVALIGVEYKVLKIATPSDSYSHQEYQKRKMDFLDEQIKQFDKPKRPRPTSPSSSPPATTTTPLTSYKDMHNSPARPVTSLRKRHCPGFQSKPFQSPLLAQPFQSPLLDRTAGVHRTGPHSSHATPSRDALQLDPLLDSPVPDSPRTDRVGKLKTLNLNWKPFCKDSVI